MSQREVFQSPIRLNLGCGGRPLPEFINVDMDSLEQLRRRYPDQTFDESLILRNFDIFNLPFADETVDEIRTDALIEHLSFEEEPKFFYEVKRVLKVGGIFDFSTPDFESAVRDWLAAKDEWKDFFRSDPEAVAQQHWFGTYTYKPENRWGYPMAMIFGPQNSPGQFHKNAYTLPKIEAILKRIGFQSFEVKRERWKGDRDMMIYVKARKVRQS